jgi:hypothetical protein
VTRAGRKLVCIGGTGMTVALLSIGGMVGAQSEPAAPPPGPPVVIERVEPGSDANYQPIRPGPFSPDDAIGFVGVEAGLGGKTVAGAPFSASLSTQTTQVLADGNRIERGTTGMLARDSQGRTRRDMTLPAIGPWATSGKAAPHVILLNDPVAQAHYILEPDQKIARKLPSFPGLRNRLDRMPPPPTVVQNRNGVTTTSLGTRTQDGLTLEGTQTRRTIPAGAIGNERPIEILVERWFSPELQVNVMIKRNDPRTGETLFQLTNIERQEPDGSLFQVPPEYTVKEGRKMGFLGKRGHEHQPPPPGDGPAPPSPEH